MRARIYENNYKKNTPEWKSLDKIRTATLQIESTNKVDDMEAILSTYGTLKMDMSKKKLRDVIIDNFGLNPSMFEELLLDKFNIDDQKEKLRRYLAFIDEQKDNIKRLHDSFFNLKSVYNRRSVEYYTERTKSQLLTLATMAKAKPYNQKELLKTLHPFFLVNMKTMNDQEIYEFYVRNLPRKRSETKGSQTKRENHN